MFLVFPAHRVVDWEYSGGDNEALTPQQRTTDDRLTDAMEPSFRDLYSPVLNQALQEHSGLTFKLIKTVADFTQQLSTIHEQHAEQLQILVETFRKRNAELRRERPPYPNNLFSTWEVLLQEVEVDSQVHGDIARSLGRTAGVTLLERTFYRKIQSRKIFLQRESFETILNKAKELLNKCHQDYTEAYQKLMRVRNHQQLAEYYDLHNAYVQQLHAANGMLEHYYSLTLPKLLEELEDVYLDLSDTLTSSVQAAAELLSVKAREQSEHYSYISAACREASGRGDVVSFIKWLPVDRAPAPSGKHHFAPPLPCDSDEFLPNEQVHVLRDELVIDRLSQLSLPSKSEALRQDVVSLETQIRQLQETLDALQRLQARSLESSLYNKSNELQEDISMKRFDLQVAHIHLAAVRAQLQLFEGREACSAEDSASVCGGSGGSGGPGPGSGRDRKASTASTTSIKNKWLKAFKSLKSPSSTDKSDNGGDKKGKSGKTESNPCTPSLDTGQHLFTEYTYKKVTACDGCREILRGHVRQGLKCKLCKLNVHPDCQDKVGRCQPKPRLLRRQKSTSEIETKLSVPEVEEETPQSPVAGRRQFLTACKTVRMSSVDLPDENEKSLSSASTSPCPSPKPHRLLPTNLYVVLYNFRSRHQDELDLKAGYTVTVIDTSDPDWWQGKCLGKSGFFPSKYVTKLHSGERPLQVTHTIQVSDGENGVKLLRDQIVIQVGDQEQEGVAIIRTGLSEKRVSCPIKFLQEV